MRRHTRKGRLAIGSLALVLTAAACGGSSDDQSGGGGSSGGGDGAVYTEIIPGGVSSLDSSNIQGFQNQDVLLKWEANLLQYEPTFIGDGPCVELPTADDLVPSGMVESYERSDDGTELNFVLNEVQSQYGNTLTTDDIQWTFDRATAIDPTASYLMYTLSGYDEENPLTIHDERSFTINVADPRSYSASMLTTLWLVVYDSTEAKAHATEDDPWATDWLAENMANFGPWQLEQFQPGVSSTYVRNENQPETEGSIERMVMSTITDAGSRAQLISGGEATLAKGLSFLQLDSLSDTDGLVIATCPSANQDFLGVNSQHEALADPIVRQAISKAINREQIVESVYQGFASPTTAGVPAVFEPTEGTSNYTFDPDEARDLLAQAGYADGLTLDLTLSPANPGDYVTSLGVALKAQLEDVGITVNINSIGDATTFGDTLEKGDFDLFIHPSAPAFADAGQAYLNVMGCEARQNYGRVCVPEIDEAAAELTRTLEAPAAAIDQLSSLTNEHLPTIALVDTQGVFAMQSCATALPTSSVFPTVTKLSTSTIDC